MRFYLAEQLRVSGSVSEFAVYKYKVPDVLVEVIISSFFVVGYNPTDAFACKSFEQVMSQPGIIIDNQDIMIYIFRGCLGHCRISPEQLSVFFL